MEDFQISLYLALLTGGFTLGGVIIGAVLQYLRERSQFNREKEKRVEKSENVIKETFLSPLFFHMHKMLFTSLGSDEIDYNEFSEYLKTIKECVADLDYIDELLKKNMHILPSELNIDIMYYVGVLRICKLSFNNTFEEIKRNGKKEKKEKLPKEVREGFNEVINILNETGSDLGATLYKFMKLNKYSGERINRTEIDKKLREAYLSMEQVK